MLFCPAKHFYGTPVSQSLISDSLLTGVYDRVATIARTEAMPATRAATVAAAQKMFAAAPAIVFWFVAMPARVISYTATRPAMVAGALAIIAGHFLTIATRVATIAGAQKMIATHVAIIAGRAFAAVGARFGAYSGIFSMFLQQIIIFLTAGKPAMPHSAAVMHQSALGVASLSAKNKCYG